MRFLIGALMLTTVATGMAYARADLHCEPVILEKLEPCDPPLGIHLKRGYTPNRCRVS